MNKNNLLSLALLFIFISFGLISATLNVSLSDQGTEVTNTSSGALLALGDLTVLIYDALTGGSLIYNETFSNAIGNGSWNIMLGETIGLPLEFGKKYYKDYLIAGEDASFVNGTGGTVGRQFFFSPLGDINSSKIFGAFTGANASINGTSGLVTIPRAGEQGQCLKGDGTWGACGSDFVCPTGFTMIETNGFQMGCIQNTKEGTSTVCQTAVLDCYDTYGGRLPEYSEIYTAVQKYASSLTDEGAAVEWLDEAHWDGGTGGSSYSCGAIDTSANSYRPFGALYTNTNGYRCFIPPGGGGGNGGAFYGSLKWDATTNCGWTTSSSTFSNLATDADCDDTARTARGLTTSATGAGNEEGQIPQIKFDSLPAGYYFVRATGFFHSNTATNSESCYWRFTDGSQNTTSNTIGGGSQFASGGTVEGEFFFASDQGATNLTLQATRQSTNTCELSVAAGNGDREFEIAVYYFPSFGTAKSDTVFSDLDGDTKINTDGNGADSDNMTFFTAGTERVVIKNDGNVGIGTSNPGGKLVIAESGATASTGTSLRVDVNTAGSGPIMSLSTNEDPSSGYTFLQMFTDQDGVSNTTFLFRGDGTAYADVSWNGGGADYAEWFIAEESIPDNALVGLNLKTGKVRVWRVGDPLVGIQSTNPGFVGNNIKAENNPKNMKQNGYALVGLVGQLELNSANVYYVGRKVYTVDGQFIGWKLADGKVFVNRENGLESSEMSRAIQEQQSQIELLQSQNDLLKSELCSRDSSYSWCKNSLISLS